jgi:hypothetical protein
MPAPSTRLAITALAVSLLATTAFADSTIALSLVGPTAPVVVNQTIDVKLRATQEAPTFVGQNFVALDCILQWNPADLKLLGLTSTGSVPLLSSYFPTPTNDYTGINEVSPPQDGTGLYYALAQLGNPVQVSTVGVQVTTFRFKVLRPFTSSTVAILPELTVTVPADTAVYDGTVPGLDVRGTLSGTVVVQTPPCPADIDHSGSVDGADLATLLGQWGVAGSADLNGSGIVDGADLAVLLNAWGACPSS